MRCGVSIQGSILVLVLCAVLSACGSSGSGGSKTPPPPTPTVTSVSVTPPSVVTVFAGTTQQFTATVMGTGNFSTVVTWSVVGDGTISNTGLFTAGNTSGQATVMATSQMDSVTGSAAVTVSVQTVSFGNWYGTLVSSDGTQTVPMDFSLTRTGNNFSTNYAVLVIATDPTVPLPPCADFNLQYAGNAQIGSVLQKPSNLTGTISGQNILMSYTPLSSAVGPPISLTGTLSPDGLTMSGAFSKMGYGCLNVTSGTFSFTQYPTAFTSTPSGTFTYGTAQVPFSINEAGTGAMITVGAIAATNCPASNYSMLSEQAGRFFHLWEAAVAQGSTPLVVWGIVKDPTGTTFDTFVMAQLNNYGGTVNQCFEPLSPLETTLTAQ